MAVEDVHAEHLLSGGWCDGSGREGEEELGLHVGDDGGGGGGGDDAGSLARAAQPYNLSQRMPASSRTDALRDNGARRGEGQGLRYIDSQAGR